LELDGYRYVVTFIDRASRWIEAKPLKSITAEEVAQAFVDTWVSRHGVPLKLSSDCGPQFHSQLFAEVCKLLGVDTVKTTAYNPKANGIVERVQKTLKTGLKCRNNSWLRDLPFMPDVYVYDGNTIVLCKKFCGGHCSTTCIFFRSC
jgi:cleavage and polyadenylation specificity factor subunit 1